MIMNKMNPKTFRILPFLLCLVYVSQVSCGRKGSKTPTDDPTSGTIHITVDESYQPMMEAEIEVFESLYAHAHINVTYASESKAFEDLLADSSRFIVVNRTLNKNELDYFKGIELTPDTLKIAYDGLAFVVNNDAKIKKLLYADIGKLFSGEIKTWNQLDSKLPKDSIRIIFDNEGSGNVRFITERYNIKDKLPANCFAVNSNSEVIDYVESDKTAIGIISVNWISDAADTNAVAFLKKIKVLDIGTKETMDTTGTFRGPWQGYIAENSYPFKRTVYIVSREARAGLGTGFASFITGDKGQRIILRSGMVPATAPIRLIQFSQ